jgi:hypothetical protein
MTRPRSRTTWGAIALAVAITIPYLGILVQSIRGAIDPSSVPEQLVRELAMFGTATQGAAVTIAFSYLAVTVGAVTVVVLLVILGLVARRQAAREAAFAVFGAIALVAGLASLGGVLGGGASSGSWLGAATSLACLGVVVLLALQSTSIDFELAEKGRRRRDPPGDGPPSAGAD